MLDQAACVACGTSGTAERVLEGCERTDPAGGLDICPPHGRGQMAQGCPAPAKSQETTCHHEDDEGEMKRQYKVSEDVVDKYPISYRLTCR